MNPGRVVWTAIRVSGWVCWLAASTVLIWRWMDMPTASLIASSMLLLPSVLEKAGVKRLLVGDSEGDEPGEPT
ncbi:hypothetical protein [Catellatospora sp. NPDC049133]|jgi:hypothetical protein|uniref:hypothetical protein n=1 Tax=Catellatospora sp. NPDC049133 TaxID=3155499 RepID=UPI0033EB0EF7